MDDLWLPTYDEFLGHKSTSISGQTFNGRNYKDPFQYSMEYYALKEEIREVLCFQEYCTLKIQKMFIDPYYGKNMKRIAHMVDEVCKEVETRRFPPGAKRGGKKED